METPYRYGMATSGATPGPAAGTGGGGAGNLAFGPPPSFAALVAGTRFGDVRWFDTIDSTNRYLLAEARQDAAEGTVAVAAHQSAGRGRLGRSWVAPPGASLLASVLFRPPPALATDRLHLITASVGLAAADACLRTAGVEAALKWPNDLVVGGRKLAGVLAESDLGARVVVVGIGLNVNWPEPLPDELAGIATALNLEGGRPRSVDGWALLGALLIGLEERYARLVSGDGWRDVASEYRRRCATVGQLVRVEVPGEVFTGTVADLSDEGHLLVDVGMCLRTVTAGDVVHLRPA